MVSPLPAQTLITPLLCGNASLELKGSSLTLLLPDQEVAALVIDNGYESTAPD
jgi:hypothetical protein